MTTDRSHLAALEDPVAQELLRSRIPARFAYVGLDEAPRVVPIWFHWNGESFVLGTPPTAPKTKALLARPAVAMTIDDESFPHKVLLVRGRASVEIVDGVVPEYALCAERYFGAEQAKGWLERLGGLFSQMARIVVEPHWARVIDFQTRFPRTIEEAMSG